MDLSALFLAVFQFLPVRFICSETPTVKVKSFFYKRIKQKQTDFIERDFSPDLSGWKHFLISSLLNFRLLLLYSFLQPFGFMALIHCNKLSVGSVHWSLLSKAAEDLSAVNTGKRNCLWKLLPDGRARGKKRYPFYFVKIFMLIYLEAVKRCSKFTS